MARRSAIHEISSDMRPWVQALGLRLEILSTLRPPSRPKTVCLVTADVVIASLSNQTSISLKDLALVLCSYLEQLDSSLELAVSLLRHSTQTIPTRFVGFSAPLNDPTDLASWLNVTPMALHSFRSSEREQSLAIKTDVFNISYSSALYKAMAKPAYTSIRNIPEGEPVIVFVPSRAHCRAVAMDLITQNALARLEQDRGYRPHSVTQEQLEYHYMRLQDKSLADLINKGLGIFHDGVSQPDRALILELYVEGPIRVLIAPHTECWTLPVRASLVMVLGTQYPVAQNGGADRQLRDYSLVELNHMQGRAVRHGREGTFHLFCQAEAKSTILHFLNEGLPLESQLLETDYLRQWYLARKKDGLLKSKQDAVDVLSFTFLARRMISNPSYYDSPSQSLDECLSKVVDDLDSDSHP